jgi:hypothetical protein
MGQRFRLLEPPFPERRLFFDQAGDDALYFVSALSYGFNTHRNHDGELAADEQIFGITAQYVNGDHPVEGVVDADVWTFGFSFKF